MSDTLGQPVAEVSAVVRGSDDVIARDLGDTGDSKCWVEKKKYCVTQMIAGMEFTNCGTKLVMTCVNIDSTDGRS